jgi:putative membrane protein
MTAVRDDAVIYVGAERPNVAHLRQRPPLAEAAVVALAFGVAWLGEHHITMMPVWAPWDFSWPTFLGAGWTLLWFLRGLHRTDTSERMPRWRIGCFVIGFTTIYVVLLTRFEYLAQHMFFLNRVQHSVMHHFGPFLIALSWPGPTIARGMPVLLWRCSESGPVRWVLRGLQQPVLAVLLFEGLLILWLIPPVTFRAMFDWRLYEIMNTSMVVDGLLFWFLVLDPRPKPPAPIGFFSRAALAFLIIFPQIAVGTLIGLSQHELYPNFSLCGRVYSQISPLLDQQIGGLVLWVPAGMMSALATIVIMRRLFLHDVPESPETNMAPPRGGNSMKLRAALPVAVIGLLLAAPIPSRAEIPEGKIKIGILQDLAGPFAEETGNGGIVAAQLAASDFATEHLKGDAEILPGAANRSTETVLSQVRDWLDKEHVAAVLSSAGPLVNQQIAPMMEQRHRTLLVAATGASTAGALCSPNAIVWGAGPSARARALVQALLPRDGKRWVLLGDRSPNGLADQSALREAVTEAGGQLAGAIDDVASGADLSETQAKIAAADPQVVVLTEDDGDLVDALRRARTTSPSYHATFAASHGSIADIDRAGLAAAAGFVVVAPFYWDTNAATRQFAQRWDGRMPGSHVDENAAEVYAATRSFLHAAKAVDDVDADKVGAELRRMPIKDTLFGTVSIRADGQVVHDLPVYRVRPAGQIQRRWAYYESVATVPGATAFPPEACRKP